MDSYKEELAKAQAEGYVFTRVRYETGCVWEIWTVDEWGSEEFVEGGDTLSDALTNLMKYKEVQ